MLNAPDYKRKYQRRKETSQPIQTTNMQKYKMKPCCISVKFNCSFAVNDPAEFVE